MASRPRVTPAFAQWKDLKARHSGCILFFRLGDFYETFGEDAVIASKELDLVLTKRSFSSKGTPLPMAGVPHHAYESYAARLLKKGYKVAICEQMEDPAKAKGPVVRREVVRILTPGTVFEETFLEGTRSNYLASVVPVRGRAGLALIDVSTGEFTVTSLSGTEDLTSELLAHSPQEVILPEGVEAVDEGAFEGSGAGRVHRVAPISLEAASRIISEHFGVESVEGLGLDSEEKVLAAGLVLWYTKEECLLTLDHVKAVRPYSLSEFMSLDATTLRNLEVVRALRDPSSREGTLLDMMDRCVTPMGSRLLESWLRGPLKDPDRISERHDAVEALVGSPGVRGDIISTLRGVKDMDRLASRVGSGSASPRDLLALMDALDRLPRLKGSLHPLKVPMLARSVEEMADLTHLCDLIRRGVEPSAPLRAETGFIRDGFSPEIDEVRAIARDSRDWISRQEEAERQRTGIRSLRIGFNKVFGYYIEVSRANLARVPPHYIRKQTLANAERFITPELKEMEEKILHAEERLKSLEAEAFMRILDSTRSALSDILRSSAAVARVDVLTSFSNAAVENAYIRPEVNTSHRIEIKAGRHPVVEHMVPSFVPNDTLLERPDEFFMILTGPNMAGKSTYMRQVALIVLMAQAGSFVPASYASIGVVDRVFTRVGAFDDLVRGQSTFMTEMVEVAGILNSATEASLILLDEMGRGTSTYDGMSLAWAVAEHIAKRCRARTIFATHYHQLTQISSSLAGVVNYHMAVKDDGREIVFLRKVIPGSTDRSYGIHVARLAGIPPRVIERAREILASIESQDSIEIGKGGRRRSVPTQLIFLPESQGGAGEAERKVACEIERVDVNSLTPLEALSLLARLKEILDGKERGGKG